jgi:hypothetical protein
MAAVCSLWQLSAFVGKVSNAVWDFEVHVVVSITQGHVTGKPAADTCSLGA